MALRSPGSNVPRIASGLLGNYIPPSERISNIHSGNFMAGGSGLNLRNLSTGGGNLSDLTAKYLKDIPTADIDTDPGKLYEGSMGGLRTDVQGAITEAGQRAISTAAASGREIADVMARYLPEAVKGYAGAAGEVAKGATELAAQGKIAKSELEQKRYGMAQEMARFDQAQAQQNQQFIAELQTRYQMAREQLANNLAVARQQAQSQAQLQSIQQAHNIQMAQLNQQFKMEATQYTEAQANMRNSLQLQLYDKYYKTQQQEQYRSDITKAVETIGKTPPSSVSGGGTTAHPTGLMTTRPGTWETYAPSGPSRLPKGTGWISVDGKRYDIGRNNELGLR